MALTLLEKLFTQLNIIGFDVVEIAPPLDPSLASMYAGRKIITEGWGYWADQIGKLVRK
jgi:arginase family enzyme